MGMWGNVYKGIGILALAPSLALASVPTDAPTNIASAAPFGASFSPVKILESTPLMTIRFYEPHARYQQGLYKAIKDAYQIKPNVNFKLVSVVPFASSAQQHKDNMAMSHNNAKGVMGDLEQVGVPSERVSLSYAEGSNTTNEVQIFVQ
ncbi:MAG: hypothetical protein K0R63_747 [Rickettsiales bacterium]|nr:hypothetical protein [Rickettsiales bacterium]